MVSSDEPVPVFRLIAADLAAGADPGDGWCGSTDTRKIQSLNPVAELGPARG